MLGRRGSRVAGRLYRAVFVDLRAVARAIALELPRNAHVLDIGGGDGEPLNPLLDLRADIRVTTIDLPTSIGEWIEARHADRVIRRPATSLSVFVATMQSAPDAVLVSDVLHHVPRDRQASFVRDLVDLIARRPGSVLLVKDVEPGYLRARLGYWSDRYITGDRDVSLVSRAHLVHLVHAHAPSVIASETPLFAADAPNYALAFRWPREDAAPTRRRDTTSSAR
jgi:2-polyprenyl-3-methyl-5-hydroxy-6-metoxy-1,4-benzoquinol methylase